MFVFVFQWDAVRGEWKKVGEVTGAAGKEGAQRTSGKAMYEGKVIKRLNNLSPNEWVTLHSEFRNILHTYIINTLRFLHLCICFAIIILSTFEQRRIFIHNKNIYSQ